MTDKEILELAAKAAGVKIDKSPYNGGGFGNTGFDLLGNAMLDWHNDKRWNPLENDADAFRLAVALGIEYGFGYNDNAIVAVIVDDDLRVWVKDGDPYAATRRAIVCAAADIGQRGGAE